MTTIREYAEETAEDQIRLDRLEHELRTLQVRCAELEIARLKHQIKDQRAFNAAKTALFDYLQTQREGVGESTIHDAVQARRATLQKALRTLVDDGQVQRTGTGKKSDAYRYQIACTDTKNAST